MLEKERCKVKRVFIMLLTLALLLPIAAIAADEAVTYKGFPEEFIFTPGSAYSKTDLFGSFKDVLPGDTITQTVRVTNARNCVTRLFLKADPLDQTQKDFLNSMRLRVTSGNTVLFDAPAGEQSGLAAYRLLGTFRKNGGTTLTITLSVPADLGNGFSGRAGGIQWTFLAQEFAPGVDPRTGEDDTDIILKLSASALIVAIAVVGVMLLRRYRSGWTRLT